VVDTVTALPSFVVSGSGVGAGVAVGVGVTLPPLPPEYVKLAVIVTLAAGIVNVVENYNSEEEIIKHAIKGENLYGIRMSEDLVRDKLDEESLNLVHRILDKDREHVDYLKSLLHS